MKANSELLEKIAEAIANKRQDLFNIRAYDIVTDAIYYAWNNWEEEIVKEFYTEDEKPEEPTYAFRKNWIEVELAQIPEKYATLIETFKLHKSYGK